MTSNNLMTLPEVADFLRITEQAAYKAASRGKIPGAKKFGRQWRFSRMKLEKHFGVKLDGHTNQQTEVTAQ